MASVWDVSSAPLALAGEDGSVHETRPTTSLARDLQDGEAFEERRSLPTIGSWRKPSHRANASNSTSGGGGGSVERRGGGAAATKPSPPDRQPSATTSPDERPIRPMLGHAQVGGGGYPTDVQRRRLSTASMSSASSMPLRAATTATTRPQQEVPRRPRRRTTIGGGEGSAAQMRQQDSESAREKPVGRRSVGGSVSAYSPIQKLLEMGFDRESARVALQASAGNVELAARIALDNAKAFTNDSSSNERPQWEVEGDAVGLWIPLHPAVAEAVRLAESSGLTSTEARAGPHHYLLDLEHMVQVNLSTSRSRALRCLSKQGSSEVDRGTSSST